MDELNFDDVYEKIKNEFGEELEGLRKQLIFKHIIALIIILIFETILAFLIVKRSLNMIVILAIFLIIPYVLTIDGFNKKYKEKYKELAISNLATFANSTYKYSPKSGISSQDYRESGFDWRWDHYKTEDKITGFIAEKYPLQMAQVHTQIEREDSDGDSHIVTTFLGIYGTITLPYTLRELRIKSNSNLYKFDKQRVEMESQEFEKYFDVFSEDRQHAMEILTPDVIEKIVALKNRNKSYLDITLKRRKIYFRVGCGNVFEAPTFKSAVNKKLLQKYFQIIDIPREIYDILIDNIKIHK